jgi:uncharacterized membrane protein YbhN (UPF0104 family)
VFQRLLPRRVPGFVIVGLKYGLGLGLLAWVVWWNWAPRSHDGLGSIWEKHVVRGEPVNVQAFALAATICLTGVLLTFLRWYVLVRAQDLPFTIVNALRLGLIGFSLNSLLPGSVGGDIIKAACVAREQHRRTVAVATVLIDRAIGLWGLGWLVVLSGGLFWLSGDLARSPAAAALQAILLTVSGLIAASVLVWLLLGVLPARRAERFARRLRGIPKVGHSAAEFWWAIWIYRNKGGSVLLALVLALAGHVCFVLTFYFAALTFLSAAQIPPLPDHFLGVPIGMAIQAGVPTPGGVGGGEAAFGWVYEQLHSAWGVLSCLSQRIILWSLALVGYLVYLQMRPSLLPARAPATPNAADGPLEAAGSGDPCRAQEERPALEQRT